MKMFKKFMDCKARIWGSQAYMCTIVYEPWNTKSFAECDYTSERMELTEYNYEKILNDMYKLFVIEWTSRG